MIRISILAVSLALALAFSSMAVANTDDKGKTKPAATQKQPRAKLPQLARGSTRATLQVEMCCAHGCPVHVHEALGELDGVTFVRADFDTQSVIVDYREKDVELRAIKDAILALGYPVDGEQPEEPHAG